MNLNKIKIYGAIALIATLFVLPKISFAQNSAYQDCINNNPDDTSVCTQYQTTDTSGQTDTGSQTTDTQTTDPTVANPSYNSCVSLGGSDSSCSNATFALCMSYGGANSNCSNATYSNCIIGGGTDTSCSASNSASTQTTADTSQDQTDCAQSTHGSEKCSDINYAKCINDGNSDISCSNAAFAACIAGGGTETSCADAQNTSSGPGSCSGVVDAVGDCCPNGVSSNNQTCLSGTANSGTKGTTGSTGIGGSPGSSGNKTGTTGSTGGTGSLAGSAPAASNGSSATSQTFTLTSPLKGVNSVSDLIFTFMKIVSYLAVIFGVIMIMWVGLQLVLAQGKPDEIKKRSSELLWVVVGIGVILGARILITTVINTLQATGTINPAIITNAKNAINSQ